MQNKIVSLDSKFHESNFCRDEQNIKGKEKKMLLHQVSNWIYYNYIFLMKYD